MDRDTKLLIAYEVGNFSDATAWEFISDLRNRLANRVQPTANDHKVYLDAVDNAFGIDKLPVTGSPVETDISTSHAGRQDLNVRMGMCRFTHLTNASSK